MTSRSSQKALDLVIVGGDIASLTLAIGLLKNKHPSCSGGQTTSHWANFPDEFISLIPDDVPNFGKRLESLEDLGDN
ncbi:MAG: hypothetical protein LQ338_002245 [Usnochroma carphineum]|nr:MAG: hypothetical protein LQ338_002245 [Usnochroma carphineum]